MNGAAKEYYIIDTGSDAYLPVYYGTIEAVLTDEVRFTVM